MIAATRITRGPHRVLRRLVRKLAKPLLLTLNQWARERSEDNVFALIWDREQISRQIAAEKHHQVKLELRRKEIAGW
ncbi:hypothetical protein [Massilia timonae]|uniref:hypothetical protein n=1 Tax=Massilia timonae TaxID=47229 RepID=UPI0028A6686B|nr:hypothetical protein [Massilia timonae]